MKDQSFLINAHDKPLSSFYSFSGAPRVLCSFLNITCDVPDTSTRFIRVIIWEYRASPAHNKLLQNGVSVTTFSSDILSTSNARKSMIADTRELSNSTIFKLHL